MLQLLGNRNFSLLWWGGLISMLGNWMLIVALPIYIYQETSSTLATSLMFIAATVPRILFGSVAGVFVDRFEHKRTMVVCNFMLALSVVPLYFVAGSSTLWLMYVVALLQSVISLFFGPAENAFLPSLVGSDKLVTANALNALNNNFARLIGPAIGGLIMNRFDLSGVLVFNLASYLVAATLIVLVVAPPKTTRGYQVDGQPKLPPSWFSQWREGLAQLSGNRVMTTVLYAMTLAAFGEGTFSVLFAPFVTEAFSGGALEFGWIMAAQAGGGIVGGILISWLGNVKPMHLFAFGLLFLGLIDLVMFNVSAVIPGMAPVLVLMVVVGVPATAIGAGYTTLLQTGTKSKFLGRVFSLVDTVSALALLAGMVVAGVVGDLIGVLGLIKVQGTAHVLAGLMALALLKFFKA